MTERTYLLPVTLRETEQHDFMSAMNDAYDGCGELPNDMSWDALVPSDLPKGWHWIERGAASSTAVVRLTDRGLAAALVLLCHVLPETEKRCPDCARRGGGWEWAKLGQFGAGVYLDIIEGAEAGLAADGWTITRAESGQDFSPLLHGIPGLARHTELLGVRPCPTCAPLLDDGKRGEPTGWVSQSWAEVLLDAIPRPWSAYERRILFGDNPPDMVSLGGCGETVDTRWQPGNQRARERIAVLADELLGTLDPPCPSCKGRKIVDSKPCFACARVCRCCGERRANGTCWPCSRYFERNIKCTEEPDGRDCDAGHALRQLGEWLALWLDAVPCRACYRIREDGSALRGAGSCGWCGRVPGHGHPDCPRCKGDGSCSDCRGSGLELGAHASAIVEALERPVREARP